MPLLTVAVAKTSNRQYTGHQANAQPQTPAIELKIIQDPGLIRLLSAPWGGTGDAANRLPESRFLISSEVKPQSL